MVATATVPTNKKGTSEVKRTAGRPRLVVPTGGRGVVAHTGARLLCELADGLGLTDGLAAAMAPTKRRRRGHDRGRVVADLAVAIADGATAVSDLRVLADQPDLFGQVASVATAWRTLGAIDADALARIEAARASLAADVREVGPPPRRSWPSPTPSASPTRMPTPT